MNVDDSVEDDFVFRKITMIAEVSYNDCSNLGDDEDMLLDIIDELEKC